MTVMISFLFTFQKSLFLLKLEMLRSVLRQTSLRSWIKLKIGFLKIMSNPELHLISTVLAKR